MLELLGFVLALVWGSTFFVLYRMLKDISVSGFLSISLIVYFFILHIMPTSLRLLGVEGGVAQFLVDGELFIKYELMESAAFLATVGLFSMSKSKVKTVHITSVINRRTNAILISTVIIVGFIAFIINTIQHIPFSYVELNNISISDGIASQTHGMYTSLMFISAIGYSMCILILAELPREKNKRLYLWVLPIIVVGVVSLVSLCEGSRIHLLTPFLICFFYYGSHHRMSIRIALRSIILLLVAVVICGRVAYVVGVLRSEGQFGLHDITTSDYYININDIANTLLVKFDTISMGALLVHYSGSGEAGLMPYIGAALAPIPRFILPSKPTPGSIDGSMLGTPAYLVPQLIGFRGGTQNVGVSPVSIAVWQLGAIGLGVFVLFNWLNLFIINTLLSTRFILIRTMGIYLLGLPSLVLITSPDQILMAQIRVAFIVAGIYLVQYFIRQLSRKWARSTPECPSRSKFETLRTSRIA